MTGIGREPVKNKEPVIDRPDHIAYVSKDVISNPEKQERENNTHDENRDENRGCKMSIRKSPTHPATARIIP